MLVTSCGWCRNFFLTCTWRVLIKQFGAKYPQMSFASTQLISVPMMLSLLTVAHLLTHYMFACERDCVCVFGYICVWVCVWVSISEQNFKFKIVVCYQPEINSNSLLWHLHTRGVWGASHLLVLHFKQKIHYHWSRKFIRMFGPELIRYFINSWIH